MTDKKELAKTEEKPKPLTLRDRFQQKWFKDQITAAMSKNCNVDRFIRVATTSLMTTRNLADCEESSVFRCLLVLGQVGLEPDGRNAHLIPRWNKKLYGADKGGYECTFQIDYKGFVELAMRSGLVASVHADRVFEEDEFDYNIGQIECHRPNLRVKRKDWYAAYSVVRFKDGSMKCEVMTQDEILEIRDRSESWKAYKKDKISTCPWLTDEGEMAKKTVFKRLSKWISISPEFATAVEHDNEDFEPIPQVAPQSPPSLILPADDRRSVTPTSERPNLHEEREERSEEPQRTEEREPETREQKEREEIQPPEESELPKPVANILGLIRKANSEFALLGVRQTWNSIKPNHAEFQEKVEAAFVAKSDSVAKMGEKAKS